MISRDLAGPGWGRAEREEALHAVFLADGIGSHESKLEQQLVVVTVPTSASHERFPVVERLDAPRRRAVLASAAL